MRSFCASGRSYFLMSKKVMVLPSVLPSAPAITVGIKRSGVVDMRYPQMT